MIRNYRVVGLVDQHDVRIISAHVMRQRLLRPLPLQQIFSGVDPDHLLDLIHDLQIFLDRRHLLKFVSLHLPTGRAVGLWHP